MKKICIALVMTIIMIFSVIPSYADVLSAEKENSTSMTKNEVEILIEKVNEAKKDGVFTADEEKQILESTDKEVLENYIQSVIAESVEAVEKENIILNENTVAIKKEIELSDGNYVIYEGYDLPEGTRISTYAEALSTTDHVVVRELYKDYGNRYFTASYTTGFMRGSIKLTVVHKYTIGDFGLKVRSSKCSATYKFESIGGSFTINYCKPVVTDSTAKSNGDDINVEGRLNFSLSGTASKGPYNKILDTRVKLIKLDKTNKQAKVKEHFYVKKDFF